MNILFSIAATFAIAFIVPMIVYGIFAAVFKLKQPENASKFLLGVAVQKIGTAVGFVLLFYLGQSYFEANLAVYIWIWIAMYAITEIGQALAPNYSKQEAIAGIISEVIYFPLAALAISAIL